MGRDKAFLQLMYKICIYKGSQISGAITESCETRNCTSPDDRLSVLIKDDLLAVLKKMAIYGNEIVLNYLKPDNTVPELTVTLNVTCLLSPLYSKKNILVTLD